MYSASHPGDLVVTYNVTIDDPIYSIMYIDYPSAIWTYNYLFDFVKYFSYLVVDADPPTEDSNSHQFDIKMNRCAGDLNRAVWIMGKIVDVNTKQLLDIAIVRIEGKTP